VQVLLHLDVALFWLINSHHSPVADVFFAAVTRLGSGWVVMPLTLGYLALAFRREAHRPLIVGALAFALAGLGSNLLKRAVDRPRPSEFFAGQRQTDAPARSLHLVGTPFDGPAFPSGHATNAFAAATLLGALLGRRWWWALAAAAAVGWSRIYLGAHFPLDVLAGTALGASVTLLTVVVSGSSGRTIGGRGAAPHHAADEHLAR
jgi:undecaprenyl-diphosphatase